MFHISALNDTSSSNDGSLKLQLTKTKEAKEAEAFAAYTKALSYQHKGNTLYAEKQLRNLFDHPLLKEASSLVDNEKQTQVQNHRGLQLLYSIHKNLAAILLQRDELQEAMAAYIQAVKIDSSEVTVWFKMGQVARKLHNYPLAKICFQQALQCNPNHWPSLDNAITVTYALGDYLTCLENISTTLEKDCGYPKGLALRKQILKEHPTLESMTKELFINCDPRIHTWMVDEQESKQFIDEALNIRAKRQQMVLEDQEKELRSLAFQKPLTPFTWQNVGEQLIELYDFATTSDPPKSLGLEVDLRDYFFLDQSVFLGETDVRKEVSTTITTTTTQEGEGKNDKRLSPQTLQSTATDVMNSSSRNQEFCAAGSFPQSLNIKANAKETALLRRIQGAGVQKTAAANKNALDLDNKTENTNNREPADLGKYSVPDEQDLEDMDVSDALAMPLLQEEDMDIAVMGLGDIRKGDLKPELLLKTKDEELLDTPDSKSLENVLSSVIDMEFGKQVDLGVTSSKMLDTNVSDAAQPKESYTANVKLPLVETRDLTDLTPIPEVTLKDILETNERNPSSPLKVKSQSTALVQSPSLATDSLSITSSSQQLSLSVSKRRESSSANDLPHTGHNLSLHLPHQVHSSVSPSHTLSTVSHSVVSVIPTHPAHIQSSHSNTHPSPPPAHTSPAVTPQPLRIPQSPQQAHISPPQTHLGPILPSPSYRVTSPISQPVSVASTQAPPPAHTSMAQNTSAFTASLKAHSPQPAHTHTSSFIYSATFHSHQPSPTSLSSNTLLAVAGKPTELVSEKYSKISVLPTEESIHSPIAASLLSPNSSGTCPKSASVYHSVLSSIEQGENDPKAKKMSNSAHQELHTTAKSIPLLEPISQEGRSLLQKDGIPKGSSQVYERRSTGDLIEDVVRNQLMKETVSERLLPPKAPQPCHSSLKSSPVHASPFPGSVQPSDHSPQHGLVLSPLVHSHSLSTVKSSQQHHISPSSKIPCLPLEDNLASGYQGPSIESCREYTGSLSLPTHHLNTLSALEAETILQASSDKQLYLKEWIRERPGSHQFSSARTRPPSLLRSSSLPGYYTQPTDFALPTYLSPPPLPLSSVSPFFSTRRKSSQQSVSLFPFLSDMYTSSASSTFLSYPHQSHSQNISTLFPYSGGLYPSLFPRPASSHLHISGPATISTLPPPNMPSRSPKYSESSGSSKTLSSSSALCSTKEKPPQEPTAFKPTIASASSSSYHHIFHSSESLLHSSPQQEQSSQYDSLLSAQLQNHCPMTHLPLATETAGYQTAAVSGDHSYHQKKGLLFQTMVESMLASSGTTAKLSTAQTLSASTTGIRLEQTGAESSPSKAIGSSKRGPKRKSDQPVIDDWMTAHKRRSTRTRSARSKKQAKSTDYQMLMKQFFPPSLRHLEEGSNQEKGEDVEMDLDINEEETGGKNQILSIKNLRDTEEENVKAYVKHCLKRHGILDLIYKFLLHLARKSDHVWYEGITGIYIKLYERLRKHLTIPTLFYGDDDTITPEGLMDYASIILTKLELSLDKAVAENGSKSYMSPSKAGQPDPNIGRCLGEFYNEDLLFLSSLTSRDDAMGPYLGEFCVRLYWQKARHHQLLNATLDAVDCFEIVTELLEEMEKEKDQAQGNVTIIVPNISQDKVISLAEAKRQLESLQRCRSFEDTQKLYDQGSYAEVVEHLLSVFSKKQNMSPKAMSQRERPSQLLLLLDSLYNIKKTYECMQWAEVSLHEAVLHYKRVPTLQLRQDWVTTLVSLFNSIDRIMNEGETILKSLSHRNLVRMAHNLVAVIEISLDVADTVTEMPIGSVLPWKILYRILKFEETSAFEKQKEEKMGVDNQEKGSKSEEEDEEPNQSLSMLIEAHKHLGRHSWCTRDEGLLLLFTISVLEREMEGKDEEDLEELSHAYEQCIYCLYGHPNKRGRAKHLSDHNAIPITLTWERAGPVFLYVAPQFMPEFDSYRNSGISQDVENLFRRIYALVPEELTAGQHLTAITNYIEGDSNLPPTQPGLVCNKETDPHGICSRLYYLLGDYYLKCKEFAKAVKFYQLDVVFNSNRLDSWAGLALAKMAQIELKLNSTDFRIDKPLTKNSDAALRCFSRAVELESRSRKLWLEYGSLAYQIHSHASRQIKYRTLLSINLETLQVTVCRHKDMSFLSKTSYCKASECEGDGSEEDWLTYYMMGKVAEKQRENPEVYLEHYKQAALCLYEENALYPKKIQFTNLPPHFALEALEIFYRIHVSVLKVVLDHQDEYLDMLNKYVTEALESPFAKGEEKPQRMKEDFREDAFVSPKPSGTPAQTKPRPVYHKNPIDHEYSRHKSTSDSQSEGEDTKTQGQDENSSVFQSSNLSSQQNEPSESAFQKSRFILVTEVSLEQKLSEIATFSQQHVCSTANKSPQSTTEVVEKHPESCLAKVSIIASLTESCPDAKLGLVEVSNMASFTEPNKIYILSNSENVQSMEIDFEDDRTPEKEKSHEGSDTGAISSQKPIPSFASEETASNKGTSSELDGINSKKQLCLLAVTSSAQISPSGLDFDKSIKVKRAAPTSVSDGLGSDSTTNENTTVGEVGTESSKGFQNAGSQSQRPIDQTKDPDFSVNEKDILSKTKTVQEEGLAEVTSALLDKNNADIEMVAVDPEQEVLTPVTIKSDAAVHESARSHDVSSVTTTTTGNENLRHHGDVQNTHIGTLLISVKSTENEIDILSKTKTVQEEGLAEVTSAILDKNNADIEMVAVDPEQEILALVSIKYDAAVHESARSHDVSSVKTTTTGDENLRHHGYVQNTHIGTLLISGKNTRSETSRRESEGFVPSADCDEEAAELNLMTMSSDFEEDDRKTVKEFTGATDKGVNLKREASQLEDKFSAVGLVDVARLPPKQVKSGSANDTEEMAKEHQFAKANPSVDGSFGEGHKAIKVSHEDSTHHRQAAHTDTASKHSHVDSVKSPLVIDGTGNLKSEWSHSTTAQPFPKSSHVQSSDEQGNWGTEDKEKSRENPGAEAAEIKTNDTLDHVPRENGMKELAPVTCLVHSHDRSESESVAQKPSSQDDLDLKNKSLPGELTSSRTEGAAAMQKEPLLLRAEIIDKCIKGLELCAARFACHYKSLYRLAHLYYLTKKYDKARDILLGRRDWQDQPHMPAPGLFSERKQNNFFQGLWKIPIDDIDRSGCFASHVHRSVRLLLDVLTRMGDLDMLKELYSQLRRTPDAGKKFLRDAERLALAEEAVRDCMEVIKSDLDKSDGWSETQREENLHRAYQVHLICKNYKSAEEANDALLRAFRIMMKGKTDVNRLQLGQALSYCYQHFTKTPTVTTPGSSQAQSKSNVQAGSEKIKSILPAPILSLERVEMEKLNRSNETPQSNGNLIEPMTPSTPLTHHIREHSTLMQDKTNTMVLNPSSSWPTTPSTAVASNNTISQEDKEDIIVISDAE